MAKFGTEYGMAYYSTEEQARKGYAEWIEQQPELADYPVRIERSPSLSGTGWAGWFWYVDARKELSNG